MMEAVSSSDTFVNIYPTTRRNISEDSHLHGKRRSPSASGHSLIVEEMLRDESPAFWSRETKKRQWMHPFMNKRTPKRLIYFLFNGGPTK
jgi:hypothetical protein